MVFVTHTDVEAGGIAAVDASARSRIGGNSHRIRIWMCVIGVPVNLLMLDQSLKKLGVTDITFMVNSDKTTDALAYDYWSPKKMREFTVAMTARGYGISPMLWVNPKRDWIRDAANKMIPLARKMAALGAPWRTIVWNAEGPWNRNKGVDHDALVRDSVIPLWKDCPVPLAMAGMPSMPSQSKSLVRWICQGRGRLNGFGMPMTYSVLKDGSDGRALQLPQRWTTPDRYPHFATKRWQPVTGPGRIIPLLDVFGREYPGWTPFNAMAAMLHNTVKAGHRELALWSLPGVIQVRSGRPGGGKSGFERRKALERFVRDRYRISYRAVAFQKMTRADLAAFRGQEYESYASQQVRAEPRYDYEEAVRNHKFERNYPTGGLLYDFDTRRWV